MTGVSECTADGYAGRSGENIFEVAGEKSIEVELFLNYLPV